MKSTGFCFIILLQFFVGSAQTTGPLSLQQCLELAIQKNLTVKQSQFAMESTKVGAAQAKTNLLPVISANAIHGINQGRSIDPYTNSYINQQVNFADYGLSGGLILFSGFGLQNDIRQQQLAYKASEMELQQSKDDLTINVIISYLTVLTGNDLVKSAGQQAEVSRRQVERLEKLNAAGAILPSQLYDLKGQLADDETNIINAKNALAAAKINLARLMNTPDAEGLELEPINPEAFADIYPATAEQVYSIAVQQLAMVKASELRKQSAEKGVATARSNFYPLLTLNGSVGTNYSNAAFKDVFQGTSDVVSSAYVDIDGTKFPVISQQDNYLAENIGYSDQVKNNVNSSLSLGLSIPILNSLQARHRVELAKIDLANAREVEQTTKISLKQDIDQAYVNMRSAYDRCQALKEQVEAYNESFRETEVRFNAGANTSVDYVIAKNNADEATIRLIVAQYDYLLRTRILDFYQGKMDIGH